VSHGRGSSAVPPQFHQRNRHSAARAAISGSARSSTTQLLSRGSRRTSLHPSSRRPIARRGHPFPHPSPGDPPSRTGVTPSAVGARLPPEHPEPLSAPAGHAADQGPTPQSAERSSQPDGGHPLSPPWEPAPETPPTPSLRSTIVDRSEGGDPRPAPPLPARHYPQRVSVSRDPLMESPLPGVPPTGSLDRGHPQGPVRSPQVSSEGPLRPRSPAAIPDAAWPKAMSAPRLSRPQEAPRHERPQDPPPAVTPRPCPLATHPDRRGPQGRISLRIPERRDPSGSTNR
jgi:hypothetical protein